VRNSPTEQGTDPAGQPYINRHIAVRFFSQNAPPPEIAFEFNALTTALSIFF
jgi:hypothetical protein